MPKERLPVTVVIPSFNGWHLLRKNLISVIAELAEGDCLLVVDDASTDNSVEELNRAYSLKEASDSNEQLRAESALFVGTLASGVVIKQLALKKNHRFAAAVNSAVALVETPLLFLLNNDVVVEPDTVDALASHFALADVFGVGCLEYEDTERMTKGGRNELYFTKGLFWHRRARSYESGPTAWVSGGSGMFAVEKWRELGGFDTAYYPAYWEDTDLSFRARQHGWQVLFDEQAIVLHHHESTNASAFGSSKIESISRRNQAYFTRKNASLSQKVQYYMWRPYWLLKAI